MAKPSPHTASPFLGSTAFPDPRGLIPFTGMTTRPDHLENFRFFDAWLTPRPGPMTLATDTLLHDLSESHARKRVLDSRRHYVGLLLCNLVLSYAKGDAYTAVSLDNNNYHSRYTGRTGYRGLERAIRAFETFGLLELNPGYYARTDQRQASYRTRIRATDRLKAFIRTWPLTPAMIARAPGRTEVIRLKDSRGRLIDYPETENTRSMRELVCAYNTRLTAAKLCITSNLGLPERDYSNNQVYRVFKVDFEHGGRFYRPWWQQATKDLRSHILIDGRPTIELDYGATVVHQLYSREGLSYHEQFGDDDPYTVPGYEDRLRAFLKTAFISMLNVGSRRAATQAIREQVRTAASDLPINGLDVRELIAAIEAKHSGIAHHFFTGVGLRLQYEDSQMCETIIRRCLDAGIIVLTIHDSYIVERQHGEFLRGLMESAWRDSGNLSVPPIRTS